jgi:excisionase family DNA binding protein
LRAIVVMLEETPQQAMLLGPDGEELPLPEELYRVLRVVAEALVQGQAVSVAPLHTQLTTQEAADFLAISRPTLVRLLESGAIPFEKPGRHRRVRLDDLLSYQRRMRRERREGLDELARDAAEDDLYATSAHPVVTR